MEEKNIHILDEDTINQIAAGEVIEGPASVIKELIENSLDAGASQLHIRISNGGMDEIKVSDNGRGIAAKELEEAFVRYGTSKLGKIEDLYALTTMGFRGEALASISAVSKVTLMSRVQEAEEGYSLVVEGGSFHEKKPIATPVGTTVKVEKLFYNAPVRQKFLQSSLKETREVVEMVEKLMLSRPTVAMTLWVDQRLQLNSQGDGNLRELAARVYTPNLAKGMKEINGEAHGFIVRGLVGDYTQTRGSREYLNFFVNQRYVKSISLSRSVEAGYKNKLPINRHPIGILYIELSPSGLEVNIHPRKMEVKIDREAVLSHLIQSLITQALQDQTPIQPKSLPDSPVQQQYKAPGGLISPQVGQTSSEGLEWRVQEQLSLESGFKAFSNPFYPLEILGVLDNTYILAKVDGVLTLVDQHAAHERINFEGITREFLHNGFKTQMLLEPVVVDLSLSDALKVTEHILEIGNYGVLLETFGEDGFLIRGLPLGMSGGEASGKFLLNLVDRLESGSLNQIKDYLIEKASCVRSVKAGERVGHEELKALIYRLGECEFPYTCPHGRPTLVTLGIEELEKMFLRS